MLLQFGACPMVRNLVKLIGTVTDHRKISNALELRQGFITFLDGLQPRSLSRSSDGLRFVVDVKDVYAMQEQFSNDSMLDDKSQSEIILLENDKDAEAKKRIIESGFQRIGDLGTGHHHFIGTVITDILILPSKKARAGSTSQAIGVIWMNPKLTYGVNDAVEMIVHELTHHLLFIDELCSPHYDYDQLKNAQAWPVSAILKTKRPFDKVLHSAVVAMEVLLLREAYVGHPADPAIHPPTAMLKIQLADALNSMEEVCERNHGILMERGSEIIDRLKMNLNLLK